MDAYPSVGSFVAGRYRIDALLGEGGMGAVFRATDAQGNAFALKFPAPEIRSRPGMMSRFANEAVAASRIASEHAVKIFGVEATEAGVPFIVMELLEGGDLDQIIENQAPIDIPRAVHFALQILRALQVAHAAGVVHRDMKPANCFVINHAGEADFLKLIDFGITKLLGDDTNQTRTSVTMGTPAYMSPEQAKSAKAAEPRSDLYSVGVILYELLTKKRPYDGDSHNELVVKICTEPPLPIRQARPDLSNDIAKVVERALVKIPAGRFENAQEFARALAPFADARSTAVLQRIEAGVQPNALAAALAPTNPVTPPTGPAPVAIKTAIMEPDAFVPEVPAAAAPAREGGGKTMLADAPLQFSPEPAPAPAAPVPYVSGLPASGAPAVVPASIEYDEPRGGGNTALFAILGVLAVALVVGGLYYGGVFSSGGSSSQPTASPSVADDEEEVEEDDGHGGKVKTKKKKKPPEDPAAPPAPTPDDPTPAKPTPAAPAKTTPKPTDGGTVVVVDAGKPTPSTTTTTTAPTIILPPGWPYPSTTTAPPATTTAPPATTTAPPATTTAPPATTVAPPASTVPPVFFPKKPKIGGS